MENAASTQPRGDQVLHQLVLAVDAHMPADQAREVDAVVGAAGAQDDALMHQALGQHARAEAGIGQQLRDLDGASVLVMGCAGMARFRAAR